MHPFSYLEIAMVWLNQPSEKRRRHALRFVDQCLPRTVKKKKPSRENSFYLLCYRATVPS
jgi:hypothetical protein